MECFYFSCSPLSHLPMLLELDCETLSHVLPCICDSVHCHRISCCLGCKESNSNTTFLFTSFMAWLDHHGIICIAIYLWIFQVCKFHKFKFIIMSRDDEETRNWKIFFFFINSFLILLCCENATYKFRSMMVPIHASVGVATFMLAVAACITGLTQKALHDLG